MAVQCFNLEHMVTEFYESLYRRDHNVVPYPNSWRFPTLNHNDLRWLNRGVSNLEVKNALFQMDGQKTLGPDGVSACFLQKYWGIVEKSLVSFIQRAFMVASFSKDMNRTLISLILKQDILECLTHFRPISLCNMVVKIISKVVAKSFTTPYGKAYGPSVLSLLDRRLTILYWSKK